MPEYTKSIKVVLLNQASPPFRPLNDDDLFFGRILPAASDGNATITYWVKFNILVQPQHCHSHHRLRELSS